MDALVDIIYWVKLLVLVVIVVLAIIGLVRGSGARVLTPWRVVLQAALAVLAFAAVAALGAAGFSFLWAAVLIVLGLVAGFFVARLEGGAASGGRVTVRRSPLVPAVWAISVILVAVTLLFGSSYLFALASLVMAFGVGMVLGQVAGELASAGRASEAAPAVTPGAVPPVQPGGVV